MAGDAATGVSRRGDGAALGGLLLLLNSKAVFTFGSCFPPEDEPSSEYLDGTLPGLFMLRAGDAVRIMRKGRETEACAGLGPVIPELLMYCCCGRDTMEPCGVPRSEPKSEEEFEPFRVCFGGGGKNVGTSKRSSIAEGVQGRDGGREDVRDREGDGGTKPAGVGDKGEGANGALGERDGVEEKMIVGIFGVAKGWLLSRLCDDWREIVPSAWLSYGVTS